MLGSRASLTKDGVAEALERYVAGDTYTGSLIVINVPKHTHSERRFRALLTEGMYELDLALM